MQAIRTWFTCKVKYYKPVENSDTIARVTGVFLVNALTFTEAEAIITQKCSEFVIGEFHVDGLAKATYSEVVPFEDADDWYKVKISFLIEDEKSGKEKPVSHFSLIQANTVKDAYDKMDELLSGSMHPFVIPSVGITKVEEIFPYDEADELKTKGYVAVERTTSDQSKIDSNDLNESETISIKNEVTETSEEISIDINQNSESDESSN